MIHKDILHGEIHIIAHWTVADAAARLALVVVANDVGKVCFQVDTRNFYILSRHSAMEWKLISATTILAADVSLVDVGSYFTTDTAEAALQQIGAYFKLVPYPFAISDETTALATGANKITFRFPFTGTLLAVRASLVTAQTSGTLITIDVNKNGTTMLSTKITIDNTEKTSVTAATPAVISVSAFTDDDECTVDIDSVGDGTAKGAKLILFLQRS